MSDPRRKGQKEKAEKVSGVGLTRFANARTDNGSKTSASPASSRHFESSGAEASRGDVALEGTFRVNPTVSLDSSRPSKPASQALTSQTSHTPSPSNTPDTSNNSKTQGRPNTLQQPSCTNRRD